MFTRRFTTTTTTTTTTRTSFATLVAVLFLACCCTARKDRNQPHPHRGLLKSYTPGPFSDVSLSRQDESKLADGQPVMKQTMPDENGLGGGAICVQDVQAPKSAVWHQILDLDAYKGKVSKVNACNNYQVAKNKDGSCRIKTRMVLGVLPGYSVRNRQEIVRVQYCCEYRGRTRLDSLACMQASH